MYITCKCNNFIGYIAVFTSLSLLVIIIHKDTFIKKPHERVYFTHVRFLIFKKSQKIIRLSNQDATSCHFLPRIVLYLYLAQSQGIFFLCHHYDRH